MATVVGSPAGALVATVVGSLGTACSDVVVDSIVVERSRGAPQVTRTPLKPYHMTLCGGGTACSDVVVDSIIVERSRGAPQVTPQPLETLGRNPTPGRRARGCNSCSSQGMGRQDMRWVPLVGWGAVALLGRVVCGMALHAGASAKSADVSVPLYAPEAPGVLLGAPHHRRQQALLRFL